MVELNKQEKIEYLKAILQEIEDRAEITIEEDEEELEKINLSPIQLSKQFVRFFSHFKKDFYDSDERQEWINEYIDLNKKHYIKIISLLFHLSSDRGFIVSKTKLALKNYITRNNEEINNFINFAIKVYKD